MNATPNGALCLGKTVENLCKAARHLRAILSEAAGRTHLGRKCDNPERREIEQKIEATTAAEAQAEAAVAERGGGKWGKWGVIDLKISEVGPWRVQGGVGGGEGRRETRGAWRDTEDGAYQIAWAPAQSHCSPVAGDGAADGAAAAAAGAACWAAAPAPA